MKKRILPALLALAMVLTMLPMAAFAENFNSSWSIEPALLAETAKDEFATSAPESEFQKLTLETVAKDQWPESLKDASEDSTFVFKASGEIAKVENWTGYSSVTEEQTGYFAAIKITGVDEGITYTVGQNPAGTGAVGSDQTIIALSNLATDVSSGYTTDADGNTIFTLSAGGQRAMVITVGEDTNAKTIYVLFGEVKAVETLSTEPDPGDTAPAVVTKVTAANLNGATDNDASGGHATDYKATIADKAISVSAANLERTQWGNPGSDGTAVTGGTDYVVGVGLPQQVGVTYAWGTGTKPDNLTDEDYSEVSRTQTTGSEEYVTFYFMQSTGAAWADNANKTGYISVKGTGDATTDYTINFNVAAKPYDITIDSAVTGGTVTTNPAEKAVSGTQVTVNAAADANKELDTITVTADDNTVTAPVVTSDKFTMPESAVTVSATFKDKPTNPPVGEQYTIKFAEVDPAIADVEVEKAATGDTTYVITAAPTKSGYTLTGWTASAGTVAEGTDDNVGKWVLTIPAATETTTAITLTAQWTAAAVVPAFGAIESNTTLYGKTPADLGTFQFATKDKTITVTGTATYISGWTAFSSVAEEQSGNYLPINIDTKAPATVVIKGSVEKTETTTDADTTLQLVMRLNKLTNKTFTVKIGDDTYTVDCTGVTLGDPAPVQVPDDKITTEVTDDGVTATVDDTALGSAIESAKADQTTGKEAQAVVIPVTPSTDVNKPVTTVTIPTTSASAAATAEVPVQVAVENVATVELGVEAMNAITTAASTGSLSIVVENNVETPTTGDVANGIKDALTAAGTGATATNLDVSLVHTPSTGAATEVTSWTGDSTITIVIPGVTEEPAAVLLDGAPLSKVGAADASSNADGTYSYDGEADALTINAKHLSLVTLIAAEEPEPPVGSGKYTIKFAEVDPAIVDVEVDKAATGDTTYVITANPTKSGYTLTGWTASAGTVVAGTGENEGKWVLTIPEATETTTAITLTATWKADGIDIHYISNSAGSVAAGKVVISGASNRAAVKANAWYLVQITSQPQASVNRGIAILQLVQADAQGKLTIYTNKSGYLFVSAIDESIENPTLASLTLENLNDSDGGNMVLVNYFNLADPSLTTEKG